MYKSIIGLSFCIVGVGASLVLQGCRQDNFFGDEPIFLGDTSLEFRGAVVTDAYANSRALTQTPVNVEPSEFDGYFYIQVNDPEYVNPDTPEVPPVNASKYGYYMVPLAGNGGVLQYAGPEELKPNWYTADDAHYFWSWTLPWTEAKEKYGVNYETWGTDTDENGIVTNYTRDGEDLGDGGDQNGGDGEDDGDGDGDTPVYAPVNPSLYTNTNPIRIKLRNTYADEFNYSVDSIEQDDGTIIVQKDSTWNPGSWGNGYFLEKFVGAKSGPYDFRRNGEEVPLQFRHLMSKISVRSLLFYRADGTSVEDLKANITFINMPTEFTLYPHPTQADYDEHHATNPYIQVDGPPIVVSNLASANPNAGITFGFTNPIDFLPELKPDEKVFTRDKFYICPEVDFSQVSFMVEFLDETYMTRGEYYGDFSNVGFEREPGTDYDNPSGFTDSEGNFIDDSKVLHAGETMYFDLIVREYGGGGYTIYVRNWNDRPEQTAKHYTHPGLYVDAEATELAGANANNIGEKFDLYGDGYWDGQREPYTPSYPDHMGIFHVYGDMELGNRTTFPLPPEYVIDGMGYILKFSPNNDSTTVTIGKMVDVYIEINGCMIYIDREGWIYTQNPTTGKFEKTDQQIDITGSSSEFRIDVSTGKLLN